jgi:hypothetical protein
MTDGGPAAISERVARRVGEVAGSPTAFAMRGSDASQIEAYYREAPLGAPAAVRHTQGGMLRYEIRKIVRRNERSGRVYIENAGTFYMKSGRNCFHPKGQTTLVQATGAILTWAKEHPRGEFGFSTDRGQAVP